MPAIKELRNSDLIKRALNNEFNVVAHCCNCFCKQKKGLALQMAQFFDTEKFDLEDKSLEGSYNKLGSIDFRIVPINDIENIWVVNMYGQYHWKDPSPYGIPLDYDAIRLCFRKLNHEFSGYTIGIPGVIGCGLAGGDPVIMKEIIAQEMTKSIVTICYPN